MSKILNRSRSPINLWYASLIIPLSSRDGKEFFSNSFHTAYDRLNPNFVPQEELWSCGIASATILLNTLLPFQKWSQSLLYSNAAHSHRFNGITLFELSHVLEICGLSPIIRYGEDETIEKQFREDLREERNFIIVNYWRQFRVEERNYTHQGGHFSLIGGFDPTTDNVLILDTSHRRFPHHWLPLKSLITMMCTYDRISAMPRGYLVVNERNQNL